MSIMRCSNGAVENTAVCLRDLDKELFSTLKIFTVLDWRGWKIKKKKKTGEWDQSSAAEPTDELLKY